MVDWTTRFSKPSAVMELNRRLAKAMMHCPSLADAGWNFRCIECHIADGTYQAGYEAPWHSHEEYQIETILSGVFQFEAKGCRRVIMRPGQALLIPLRLPHRFKCVKRGVMVGLSLEVIPTVAQALGAPPFSRKPSWLTAHPIRAKLLELIQSGTVRGQVPFNSIATACHLFLFLAEVMQRVVPSPEESPAGQDQQISEIRGGELVGRIINRLNTNPALPITLGTIARESALSARQVHRLFLRHTGKSLREWVFEQRLEMARNLIEEQGRSAQIKQIAFDCGFSSANYFSTTFHKHFGCSPTEHAAGSGAMRSRSTLKSEAPPEPAGD